MRRKIELLAPGGDVDSVKAAIIAGADAVYCGLEKFNARNRSENISFENLQGIIRLAHKHNCEVFLTLNIIIVESEIAAFVSLLNKLINTGVDGVIIQDLGMFDLINKSFKSLKIHASTQLTTHNKGQVLFLQKLGATRVNLSRELAISEIKELAAVGAENNVLTEVFVHGSYCISFSGICYMSSVQGGKSGNRGQCSQPCRDKYLTTANGNNFPLNLKDNSAYFNLKELHDAGVASLKIEGRIKGFEYVYTIVDSWRKQIQSFLENGLLLDDDSELYRVFNRDFSNGYLKGKIGKDMFIDDPMSYSSKRLEEVNDYSFSDKLKLYDEKADTRAKIKQEIDQLSIGKIPLKITVSGKAGELLRIEVEKPDALFAVSSEVNLAENGVEALTEKMVLKRLKAINETEYFIEHLNIDGISGDMYIPFKELTALKKKLLVTLNDSKEMYAPVAVPVFKKQEKIEKEPTLSVLISSKEDVALCEQSNAVFYFQLPNGVKNSFNELVDLFRENEKLIPWFPEVLIGDDYDAAVEFLETIPSEFIVTNNTGIAYAAYKSGIRWIAGPFLNTVNSFSLLSLKENFNCAGAFISNELSRTQIRSIKKPDDFDLFYSIYHPVVLMTSRQCLFQQVTGCAKNMLDKSCIQHCEKSASIKNLKDAAFFIEKSAGNLHRVYNETNFLNTQIVRDIPNFFSGFLIDLSDIKTRTETEVSKSKLIALFEEPIKENPEAKTKLKDLIHYTNNKQYLKGI
ncbi:peptidase U32 family protein [Draconibacterium halophilum]|uniref:U32 family peptidase n=1 Tax=Draconibacterium halophilum TaxID=2706887 RepID=A0A6C0RGT6_9BACT|nr:U32 family peptidase [Draconibacterium halophilum]QIA08885.1 U32 family peptidase [Draconibacterium halophilum]